MTIDWMDVLMWAISAGMAAVLIVTSGQMILETLLGKTRHTSDLVAGAVLLTAGLGLLVACVAFAPIK